MRVQRVEDIADFIQQCVVVREAFPGACQHCLKATGFGNRCAADIQNMDHLAEAGEPFVFV